MGHTESIHFDSRILIRRIESKIKKKILIHFDSQFISIFICDSIWFYSFWFGLILIRRESKIKSDQKSKVGEAWFTNCRIIGCFDFESKANQSESRIKLVRALVFTGYEYLKNLGITTCFSAGFFKRLFFEGNEPLRLIHS